MFLCNRPSFFEVNVNANERISLPATELEQLNGSPGRCWICGRSVGPQAIDCTRCQFPLNPPQVYQGVQLFTRSSKSRKWKRRGFGAFSFIFGLLVLPISGKLSGVFFLYTIAALPDVIGIVIVIITGTAIVSKFWIRLVERATR